MKSELSLSLEIRVAEKSVMNDKPKTEIPGAKLSIANRSTGIFACIALSNNSNTTGNPNPNERLRGSRKISFAHLLAKVIILIPHPPLQS